MAKKTDSTEWEFLLGDVKPDDFEPKDRWRNLPPSRRPGGIGPEKYVVSDDLRRAVNVAIALGKPLLLTGEPGTGKSKLADYVAWEFGLGEPLDFVTKSTTVSTDLFYTFDAIGRLHAARPNAPGTRSTQKQSARTRADDVAPINFIDYQALGKAVLYSNPKPKIKSVVKKDFVFHPRQPTRSVVLIDEIDKAPRDVPNDILDEIENLRFTIKELGGEEVRADDANTPIIIITSNSERTLPDAFLRRCVYFDIQAPDQPGMEKIVQMHLGNTQIESSKLVHDLLEIYYLARGGRYRLAKTPATAELLDTLYFLRNRYEIDLSEPLDRSEDNPYFDDVVSTLFKRHDDRDAGMEIIKDWRKGATAS